MIEMTRCIKNRCMRYEKLPPWKCPPPPKKPFPWKYILPWIILFTSMGAIYRLYIWKEENDKINAYKPIWRPRPRIKKPLIAEELPDCVQYLIVGSGAAAWSAYQTIAKLHEQAKVFIITLDDVPPYAKPPLTKFMWWNPEPPNIKTLKYIEEAVEKTMYFTDCKDYVSALKFVRMRTGPAVGLASGWWVTRVDPEEHCVYVDSVLGEVPVYYERCLLAPGARPKKLSVFERADKQIRKKVTYMSNIRDLEIGYRRVQEAKHVTIIGGGILGSELAWTLAKRNQQILSVDPEEEVPEVWQVIKDGGIMPAILPEYLGAWAANKIRAEGVNIVPHAQVYDVYMDEDDRLNLILSNGEKVVTDHVFVAVGVEPRVEIALRSDLEIDEENGGGIVVNGELEARKHLFVAGDAANVYTPWKNSRLRFDHFENAFETGALAGANMTGEWTATAIEPHFWYILGKIISMEVIGEVGACMPIVGIFKECDDDEEDAHEEDGLKKIEAQTMPLPVINADGDKPCPVVLEAHPCRNLYKRGMLFYIRDDIIVGITFWNIPPVEDRTKVVSEMLRSRPHISELNMLAEMLGFHGSSCVYSKAADEIEPPICFQESTLKKW